MMKNPNSAAVALPAYQDYTIRAKVSELILAASSARTGITEKFQTDPSSSATMGTGMTINVAGKISGATVGAAGTIEVTGAATSTSTGAAITLTVLPTSINTANGTMSWSCAGTPSKYMPAAARLGEATVGMLHPATRTFGLVFSIDVQGAVIGAPLSFGQSLLLVWPQFTGLIAGAIVLFAVSYMAFQRQEVRA